MCLKGSVQRDLRVRGVSGYITKRFHQAGLSHGFKSDLERYPTNRFPINPEKNNWFKLCHLLGNKEIVK